MLLWLKTIIIINSKIFKDTSIKANSRKVLNSQFSKWFFGIRKRPLALCITIIFLRNLANAKFHKN